MNGSWRERGRDLIAGWLGVSLPVLLVMACPGTASAERWLAWTPQAADAPRGERPKPTGFAEPADKTSAATGNGTGGAGRATANTPLDLDDIVTGGRGSDDDRRWAEYLATWRAHHLDPADPGPRRRLGLPERAAGLIDVSDGATLAREYARTVRVRWSNPRQVTTKHFLILADAELAAIEELALELERFHAIWSQLFFPLWKDRGGWDRSGDVATGRAPARSPPRSTTRGRETEPTKLRVVIFRDLDQYQSALAGQPPATRVSTGFYSEPLRTTFLRQPTTVVDPAETDTDLAAIAEARATLYHELTHQLLAEATEARAGSSPGMRGGFWLAEAVACLMESTHIRDGRATVGGWESSRLQFARHRVLVNGDSLTLSEIEPWGRNQFLRSTELARGYAFAAAHAHRIADRQDGQGWHELLARVARLYQIRTMATLPPIPRPTARDRQAEADELADYLRLDDPRLTRPAPRDLFQLCLARCALTAEAIGGLPPQRELRWLDLTGIPVATVDVTRLLPEPHRLKQLSLEATGVGPGLGEWLARATALEELDLSWTQCDDTVINGLAKEAPLSTLWLTGSSVSDESLPRIAAFRSLQRLDIQRTTVTEAGRARFRTLRPDVILDPLELVPSP